MVMSAPRPTDRVVVDWDVAGLPADLTTVETLARFELAGRRHGYTLRSPTSFHAAGSNAPAASAFSRSPRMNGATPVEIALVVLLLIGLVIPDRDDVVVEVRLDP